MHDIRSGPLFNPYLDTPVTWYYYVGFGGVITACLEKETVNDATL